MAKKGISGWIFVFVGGIVTIISLLLSHLTAFIYIGIIFVLYGFVKVLFSRSTKEPKPNTSSTSQQKVTNPTSQKEMGKPQLKVHYHPQTNYQYVICPRCGYHMHTSYRFCPRCGYEVPTQ